jgi:hypothetical protein
MLLLPAPRQRVKDGGHAVKRLAGQVIQKVTTATFSHWLDLPEFALEGYIQEQVEGQKVLHLFCTHRHKVALCPRCQTPSTMGHDVKERSVRDLDLVGQRVFLHFPARRFDCERCGRPFTEALLDAQRQTRRFEQRILKFADLSSQDAHARAQTILWSPHAKRARTTPPLLRANSGVCLQTRTRAALHRHYPLPQIFSALQWIATHADSANAITVSPPP